MTETAAAADGVGFFWFHFQGANHGPIGREEVTRWVEEGRVRPETWCWHEGLDTWRPVAEVPAMRPFFGLEAEVAEPSADVPDEVVETPVAEPILAQPAKEPAPEPTASPGRVRWESVEVAPSNAAAALPYASFGRRFAAGGIDVLLLSLLALALMQITGEISVPGIGGVAFYPPWLNLIVAIYMIGLMSRYGGGQTVGYRAMHIRMIDQESGEPPSLRQLLYWQVGLLLQPIGWVWYFTDPRKRMLHNIVSKTVVVHQPD
jgi:uncharacterized RDD family membrane protein YckC